MTATSAPSRSDDAGTTDSALERTLWLVCAEKRTGRLTSTTSLGDNHLFFVDGGAVGVHLAEPAHSLGAVLLGLGKVDAATRARADAAISAGNRVPGQVFKELGVLDDDGLRDALQIQARLKAEHFCRLTASSWRFDSGMTWVNGFSSAEIPSMSLFVGALRGPAALNRRAALFASLSEQHVRVAAGVVPGIVDVTVLSSSAQQLARTLCSGGAPFTDLGVGNADDAGLLLHLLDVVGVLEREPARVMMQRAPTARIGATAAAVAIFDDDTDTRPPPPPPRRPGRRTEPPPSAGSGLQVSETKSERSERPALPSIVVDE